MSISFNPDDYPEVDAEYEDFSVQINAKYAMKGDRFEGGNAEFGKITNGHKYTTIFDKDGRQLWRGELYDIITVVRTRETSESRERTRRVDSNRRIIREVQKADLDRRLNAAVEKIQKEVSEYHFVDDRYVGSLLTAQAERRVWAHFLQAAEYVQTSDDHTGDPVSFLEEYLNELKNQLIKQYPYNRALSRSTSVLSNLYEDVEAEAIADFIDGTKWWA